MPDLFADGSYEPVAVEGPLADHVVAFVRRHEGDAILVVVPRLPTPVWTAPIGLDRRTSAWPCRGPDAVQRRR